MLIKNNQVTNQDFATQDIIKDVFFYQNFQKVIKSSKELNESNTPKSANT